jgi:hypothetical protein
MSSGWPLCGFPTKILYAFPFTPVPATCPSDLTLPDFIILHILGTKSPSYEALHYAVFSSLLHFICLRSKYSSQHPVPKDLSVYVLYILMYMFLDSRWEDRRLWTEWWWFINVVPKYMNCATFSNLTSLHYNFCVFLYGMICEYPFTRL